MGNSLYLGDKFLGGTIIDDMTAKKDRTWSSEKIFNTINATKVLPFENGYLNAVGEITQEEAAVQPITNTVSSNFIDIPNNFSKVTAYVTATINADATTIDSNTSNSTWLAVCFYDEQKQFIARITPIYGNAISPYKDGNKSLTFCGEDIPANAKYLRLSWRNWQDGDCRYLFNDTIGMLARLIDYTYTTDNTFANVFTYDGMEFGYLGGTNNISKPTSGNEYTNKKAYTSKELKVTGTSILVDYDYYIQEVMNSSDWTSDPAPDPSTWGCWLALDKNKQPLNSRPQIDNTVFGGKKQSQLTAMMDENGHIKRSFSLQLPAGTKYVRFSWRTYGINPTDAKGSAQANAVYGLDMQVKSSQIVLLSDIE